MITRTMLVGVYKSTTSQSKPRSAAKSLSLSAIRLERSSNNVADNSDRKESITSSDVDKASATTDSSRSTAAVVRMALMRDLVMEVARTDSSRLTASAIAGRALIRDFAKSFRVVSFSNEMQTPPKLLQSATAALFYSPDQTQRRT